MRRELIFFIGAWNRVEDREKSAFGRSLEPTAGGSRHAWLRADMSGMPPLSLIFVNIHFAVFLDDEQVRPVGVGTTAPNDEDRVLRTPKVLGCCPFVVFGAHGRTELIR